LLLRVKAFSGESGVFIYLITYNYQLLYLRIIHAQDPIYYKQHSPFHFDETGNDGLLALGFAYRYNGLS